MIRTSDQIREIIEQIGFYMDPDHPSYIEKEKKDRLPPPFLEYDDDVQQFFADGICFFEHHRITIRLFADDMDKDAENAVRRVLMENELAFRQQREQVQDPPLWMTTFTMEA